MRVYGFLLSLVLGVYGAFFCLNKHQINTKFLRIQNWRGGQKWPGRAYPQVRLDSVFPTSWENSFLLLLLFLLHHKYFWYFWGFWYGITRIKKPPRRTASNYGIFHGWLFYQSLLLTAMLAWFGEQTHKWVYLKFRINPDKSILYSDRPSSSWNRYKALWRDSVLHVWLN